MTEKTNHQLVRFLDKINDKFPLVDEPSIYTDIHIMVTQETGDIMAFDDEDNEITRCVIEEWIDNNDSTEKFYMQCEHDLRLLIASQPRMGIIMPYNYVLENENGEHITELFVVDDSETIILGTPFMQDLDKDLDDFINNLLKD